MTSSDRMSGVQLFFLWFGAAVSVAEMLTGGMLADLGLTRGLWANVVGHALGCGLLVLGGLVGWRERLPAIRSMRLSFGAQGSYLLSVLNVLQLVGWTAVMVMLGGSALAGLWAQMAGPAPEPVFAGVVGLLVAVWVFFGVRGFKRLNTAAVVLLFGLTVALTVLLLRHGLPEAAWAPAGGSFSLGLELAVIMPLSWFPLIADYTSLAESRRAAWLGPLAGYFLGSVWMYGIGLVGAAQTGQADPSAMLVAAGLGAVALAIVGLSTVTTTFLDVWSAAVSSQNVRPRLSARWAAVGFALLGTGLGAFFPMERYEWFLYLLGSVFAPIVAILLVDAFVLGEDRRGRAADPAAFLALALGVAFYYVVQPLDPPAGPTLCTVAFSGAAHLGLRLGERALRGRIFACQGAAKKL
ncbi:MAG: putative hydroxymethylpyrimidine transporter CytX [Desulfovibrionaceae bacterium]